MRKYIYQLSLCIGGSLAIVNGVFLVCQQPSYAEYMAMAHASVHYQRLTVALQWFQQANQMMPHEAAPFVGMATIYLYRDDIAAAKHQARLARAIAPNSSQVWQVLSEIAAKDGNGEQLLQAQQHLFALTPNATTAIPYAIQSFSMGKPAQVAKLPSFTDTTATLAILQGIAALHMGDIDRARQDFTDVTQQTQFQPFIALAQKWQGCTNDFISLGVLDLQQGWYWLARTLLQQEIITAHTVECQQQTTTVPAIPDIHAAYAWALWQTGATADAQTQVTFAAADDSLAVFLNATMLLSQGKQDTAFAIMDDWCQNHGTTAAALWLLGQAAFASYHLPDAEAAWWNLLQITPSQEQAPILTRLFQLYETGTVGRTNGHYDQLVALALPLANAHADLLDHLATWATVQRQPDEALGYLQQAVHNAPYSAILRLHLGKQQYQLGNLTDAAIQLTTAEDLTTDATICQQADALLTVFIETHTNRCVQEINSAVPSH